VLAHEVAQPHAGHGAEARRHLLHDDQRDRDRDERPEERVAVLGAGRRVGRDAAGVVAGVRRDEAGAEDAEKEEEAGETAGERRQARGVLSLRAGVLLSAADLYLGNDDRPSV